MSDTAPDFRALCAELLSALEAEGYEEWSIDPEDHPLCERARAALTTSPPEPPPYWPTKGEVIQLAMDTRLYRFQATAGDPIQYEMTEAQLIAFARAALERWG
jgi:hypothetical protein